MGIMIDSKVTFFRILPRKSLLSKEIWLLQAFIRLDFKLI